MINYEDIKLIIWDLDDTFWKGTLSEGPVQGIPENISLLRELTEHGIINTICSKNDEEQAIRQLKTMHVDVFFVFSSINWMPKGQRISKQIKDMGLRAANCLFIDDNEVNLNEALFYEKRLMVAKPELIPLLAEYLKTVPANDKEGKRLKNYQILEEKQHAKAIASDNMEFLYSSNTQVTIHQDCLNHLDRIFELVSRTNQLNYTKKRSTKEELEFLCKDPAIETGYVTVKDKFGDYGIVGFYAIRDNKCIHFLFSCRTIGQGVEQYVYSYLHFPTLVTVGDVVNEVRHISPPSWINQNVIFDIKDSSGGGRSHHGLIILKGACDMKAMAEYLQSDKIIGEYSYIGQDAHNYIEHQNHSINYLQFHFLPNHIRRELLEECIFNDEEMFNTSIYDKDVSLIFLSTMMEPNLGIYQRKRDGLKIAFGEYTYPLTDEMNWEKYINQEVFTADNKFTYEWLSSFSKNYEFVGTLSPSQIIHNAEILLDIIPCHTKVCFILGSEMPFANNTQANYQDRHLIYQEMNQLFREMAKRNKRVLLIDINNFINGQEDFTNNINHFQRRVYFEMAQKANEYIQSHTGEKLKVKGKFFLYRKKIFDKIVATGIIESPLWKWLHRPWVFLKSLSNH